MSTTSHESRILGVDLRDLPEANMEALRREAIARNTSLPDLLSALIDETSNALLSRGGESTSLATSAQAVAS